MSSIRLTDISAGALADAADANFVVHTSWVPERVPGMRVTIAPEIALVDSGLACDTFNFICRARFPDDRAAEQISEALTFFRSVDRPFSWWVGPADQPFNLGDLLLEAGLQRAETELAMAADLAVLRTYDLSRTGVDIRRVRTAGELRDFARIVAANWTPPDQQVERFYELAAPVLLAPDSPQWLYVGYLAGESVATAELTVGGGVVGLYSICTLEAYRGRGIGTALTLQPLLHARDAGFRTGVLQAASAGVGVYNRLGFTRFGSIAEYKPRGRDVG